MSAMRVSVLGSGRWGSCLAWYCSSVGHEVTLWGRPGSQSLSELFTSRSNAYLALPPGVELTTSLDDAISSARVVLVAVSAQHLRSLCGVIAKTDYKSKVFSLNMKGLEASTGKRLSEVMAEELECLDNVAVWVGPGHVQDLLAGIPNCMVVTSRSPDTAWFMIEGFSSRLIRLYYNPDLIGTEVGAATKNIYGIAAGMLDGLGLPSLKGPLMARGPYEASRLIHTLGGDERSAYGLAHLGDYEATLFSKHSRNRRFGEAFVKNEGFEPLAEGVTTLKAVSRLVTTGIELPIASTLTSVLERRISPREGLELLFLRPQRTEFAG